MRDYVLLVPWLDQRALPTAPHFNTRPDHAKLGEMATAGGSAIVLMQLKSFKPAGSDHLVLTTGSDEQRFNAFVPDGNTGAHTNVVNLINTRHIAGPGAPRRSYAYGTGTLKLLHDKRELVVTSTDQVTDWPTTLLERTIGV